MAYGLWNGDDPDSSLYVRKAHEDETAHAIQSGDLDADDKDDWAVWLVSLNEPDEPDDCD